MIETDRQLLFEKLNSSQIEKSVLSITSSMTSLNDINQLTPSEHHQRENQLTSQIESKLVLMNQMRTEIEQKHASILDL